MLGQGADTQFHRARESKCRINSAAAILMNPGASPHCGANTCEAPSASLHGFRNRNIFSEIEIVQSLTASNLGNHDIAEKGQPGNHGSRLVRLHMLCQSGLVGRTQVKGFQVIEAVGLDNLRRCAGFGVGQLHTVVAALSEQAGNQSYLETFQT